MIKTITHAPHSSVAKIPDSRKEVLDGHGAPILSAPASLPYPLQGAAEATCHCDPEEAFMELLQRGAEPVPTSMLIDPEKAFKELFLQSITKDGANKTVSTHFKRKNNSK